MRNPARTLLYVAAAAGLFPGSAAAQVDGGRDMYVARGAVLERALGEVAERFGLRVYFAAADVRDARSLRVDLGATDTAPQAMAVLSAGSDLTAIALGPTEYVVVPDGRRGDEAYVAQVADEGRRAARAHRPRPAADTTTHPPAADAGGTPDLLIADEPLYRAFDRIAERYGVRIYYHPDDVPAYRSFVPQADLSLTEVLRAATAGTGLLLVKYAPGEYVVGPRSRQGREYADDVVEGWRTGRYRSPDDPVRGLRRVTFGEAPAARPGDTATVRFVGRVVDAETGEPLFGVIVYDPARAVGTATDLEGEFDLRLPLGERRLEVRSLGYETQPLAVTVLGEAGPLALSLHPRAVGFDAVVVTARSRGRAQREAAGGLTRLTARELDLLPTPTGDVDVLAALTSRPGVTSTAEGAAGVSVRGGALDQNLVRQAGMAVLYPAHALGFYPVFHPDLVAGVSLYRGYVPPALGGRAASAIEVDWRRGSMERWSLRGGGGAFASRVAVEGPLVPGRVSVLAGGRLSYVNYLLGQVRDRDVARSRVGFADVGARLTYRWEGGQFDAVGAYARDDFRYGFAFAFGYVNRSARVSLTQRVAARTTLALEASASGYAVERDELRAEAGLARFATGLAADRVGASLRRDLRADDAGELAVSAGAEAIRYDPAGRRREPLGGSAVRAFDFPDPRLLTVAAYVAAEFASADDRWRVEGGLRVERHVATAPAGTRYTYDGPAGLERVIGEVERASGEAFALPVVAQPRLSATFTPAAGRHTLGLSYARLAQPLHHVSPTVSPTPADVFLVSGEHVPLTTAHSFGVSVAAAARRGERRFGYEVGGYYRRSLDVNLGRQGTLLRESPTPERGVYTADGFAYGAEASLRYAGLRTRLGVAYAFGRSFVDADGRYPEFSLAYRYRVRAPTDLPHQVNVTYAYEPSGRVALTATWTFASGRPFTPTDGLLPVDGGLVPVFGQPNSARLPPTHRLDVGFSLDNAAARRRGVRFGFDLSIYNLYMRDNPYLTFYDRRSRSGRLEAFQLAVIGEAIPALTVTLRWD